MDKLIIFREVLLFISNPPLSLITNHPCTKEYKKGSVAQLTKFFEILLSIDNGPLSLTNDQNLSNFSRGGHQTLENVETS